MSGSPGTVAVRKRGAFRMRWKSAVVLLLSVLLLLGGGYLGFLQLSGNFHAVVPGECYRSAQLTPSQIADFSRTHGIQTIVNLRGPNVGKAWYDAEILEAERLGIDHVDFRMAASRELTPLEANQLVAVLRRARKPVLVHCKSGADRSGLASALYLAAVKDADLATAERELSIEFGHLSLPFLSAYAMDRTFEKVAPTLVLRREVESD